MQLSVPPPQQPQFQNHAALGQIGPQINQFGGVPYGNMGSIGGLNTNLAASLGGGLQQQQQRDPRTMNSSKPSELIIPGPEQPSVLSPAVVEPPARSNHEQNGKNERKFW